ncbi:hypothetical protein PT974_07519 [Cladobotryum mycophilum]|uniref:Uncharacterized protein n=1 Tax=Cladobotryum mycophilum TaxID=491253 RepID=A0ABR0SPQ2_9HYPO
MSPETDHLATSLLQEANAAKAIKKSVDKSKAASETIARVEKEAEITKTQLEVARAKADAAESELRQLNFLLAIGDWASELLRWLASYEDLAKLKSPDEEPKDGKTEDEKPKDARAIQNQVNEKTKWPVLKARNTQRCADLIFADEEKVRQWRKDGASEEKDIPPLTPCLDRLEEICRMANFTRANAIKIVKTYAARNDKYHRKPPDLSPFIISDAMGTTSIDWKSAKVAWEGSKRSSMTPTNDMTWMMSNSNCSTPLLMHGGPRQSR